MGKLIQGDDGLPAEDVGPWIRDKHEKLRRYIDISSAARRKYIGFGKGGAVYIDLFCGPGRACIRGTEFVDGSCLAAWHQSVASRAPFSRVLIGDLDEERLQAATLRLQKAGAPVQAFPGAAVDTVRQMIEQSSIHSLFFTFLDPFSLGALDFKIFQTLAKRKRMDVLVHLSKMDLQRNLGRNIAAEESALDAFAPGWRDYVTLDQRERVIRTEIIDYWKGLVSNAGFSASPNMQLLKGSQEQHLYWLLLVASHELAHRFWGIAGNTDKQGTLF